MQGLTNQCGVGRGAANGLPDRIGKNPKTARANIVTWADRRVGHGVDTKSSKRPELMERVGLL